MTASLSNKTSLISRFSLIFLVIFTVFFFLVVYTFLHEAGHAVFGLAFGQTLTSFNINFIDFSAHTSLSGDLTPLQSAVKIAAGVLLPLLVWFGFIHLTPPKPNFSLHILRLIASISVLSSLLPWIILPLFRLAGNPLQRDDVTNFLSISQMPPLLLTALAACIFTFGLVYFLSRVGRLGAQFQLIGQVEPAAQNASVRTSIPLMTAILAVCFIATWIANLNAVPSPIIPDGFQQVAAIDLSTQSHDAEVLYTFSLAHSESVAIFYLVENINTSFFDLRLEGPQDYKLVLVQGEDWDANQVSGNRQESLLSGNYQLSLTADKSPGKLSVYLKYP